MRKKKSQIVYIGSFIMVQDEKEMSISFLNRAGPDDMGLE